MSADFICAVGDLAGGCKNVAGKGIQYHRASSLSSQESPLRLTWSGMASSMWTLRGFYANYTAFDERSYVLK